jgi:hypothetical protein
MSSSRDIDFIFADWPFKPGVISAKVVQANDGRQVLQMRIEMGILQMEMIGRPDGEKPGGESTYLELLQRQFLDEPDDALLSPSQCMELDREFLQFYHRRICCLALRQFARAAADADHTLLLMDFAAKHSPNPEWTLSHEQYRPFVLFHRAQATAMVELQRSSPEAAIEAINSGLADMQSLFAKLEMEEQFESDELVGQLVELKESLRQEYHVGQTLAEQLADAVAKEQYEHAARLRDEIARRHQGI